MIKAILSKNILVLFLVTIKAIFPKKMVIFLVKSKIFKKYFVDVYGHDKSNIFRNSLLIFLVMIKAICSKKNLVIFGSDNSNFFKNILEIFFVIRKQLPICYKIFIIIKRFVGLRKYWGY